MTLVAEKDWTLHYTIGRVLAAAVRSGDVLHMPGGRSDLLVVGGRAPQRVNDIGSVIVRDLTAEPVDKFEMRPGALGMVWISTAGGWSELPAQSSIRTIA